jgi:hypothetical protein
MVTTVTNLVKDQAYNSVLCFPNPSNGSTTIQFELKKEGRVEVFLTDLLGRTVYSDSQWKTEGSNQIVLDKVCQVAGTYFLKLNTPTGVKQTKLVIE